MSLPLGSPQNFAQQVFSHCGGILEKSKFTVHMKLYYQFEEAKLLVEKWVLDVKVNQPKS